MWSSLVTVYAVTATGHEDASHKGALSLLQSGRYVQAEFLLGKAAALQPAAAEVRLWLGQARIRQDGILGYVTERSYLATRDFQAALQLNPQRPFDALVGLGTALKMRSHYTGAAEAFRSALGTRPRVRESLDVQGDLADVLERAGIYRESADAWDASRDLALELASREQGGSTTYVGLQQVAAKSLERSASLRIGHGPNSARGTVARRRALCELWEACVELDVVDKHSRQDNCLCGSCWFRLAALHLSQGQLEEAEAPLQKWVSVAGQAVASASCQCAEERLFQLRTGYGAEHLASWHELEKKWPDHFSRGEPSKMHRGIRSLASLQIRATADVNWRAARLRACGRRQITSLVPLLSPLRHSPRELLLSCAGHGRIFVSSWKEVMARPALKRACQSKDEQGRGIYAQVVVVGDADVGEACALFGLFNNMRCVQLSSWACEPLDDDELAGPVGDVYCKDDPVIRSIVLQLAAVVWLEAAAVGGAAGNHGNAALLHLIAPHLAPGTVVVWAAYDYVAGYREACRGRQVAALDGNAFLCEGAAAWQMPPWSSSRLPLGTSVVLEHIDSVESAVSWMTPGYGMALIFVTRELADGVSYVDDSVTRPCNAMSAAEKARVHGYRVLCVTSLEVSNLYQQFLSRLRAAGVEAHQIDCTLVDLGPSTGGQGKLFDGKWKDAVRVKLDHVATSAARMLEGSVGAFFDVDVSFTCAGTVDRLVLWALQSRRDVVWMRELEGGDVPNSGVFVFRASPRVVRFFRGALAVYDSLRGDDGHEFSDQTAILSLLQRATGEQYVGPDGQREALSWTVFPQTMVTGGRALGPAVVPTLEVHHATHCSGVAEKAACLREGLRILSGGFHGASIEVRMKSRELDLKHQILASVGAVKSRYRRGLAHVGKD